MNKIIKQGIRVKIIGDKKGLPHDIKKIVKNIEKRTIKNKKITLNLALNYGSKEEIINACKNLVTKRNMKINVDSFKNELYTKNIPDPEILIRTGGTKRLSNFLLWQIAYSEIYFTKTHWPSFDERELIAAIQEYQKRERRFGKVSEQIS